MKITTIVFPILDGKIFLSEKKIGFGKGYLNGYGGKKNLDDLTIEDTASRELKEECGIVSLDLEKVAVIEFFEENNLIFQCHIYFCKKWQGEFKETQEMGLPKSYNLDNLPFSFMWDGDKIWLPIICSGVKINAKSYYNKGMTKQVSFEYKKVKKF